MREIAEEKKNAKARDATPYPAWESRASLGQLRRAVDHECRGRLRIGISRKAVLKVAKKAAMVGGK